MKVKYIAEGFFLDARKLLNDYVSRNSRNFKTFACVWREHNFSCVLMARPNIKEFTDFVNEIYQITLNYMMTSPVDYKIGCAYILYSLYRSQTFIESPVLIRVTPDHYTSLKFLKGFADSKRLYSLSYVLEFLFANCLSLVTFPSLYGPLCPNRKIEDKPKFKDLNDYKSLTPGLLEEFNLIKNNHCEYLKMKKDNFKERREIINKTVAAYETITNCIGRLKGDEKCLQTSTEMSENIGNRRVKLKQQSYEKKAMFRHSNKEDPDYIPVAPSPVKKEKKKKIKKRGRPCKQKQFCGETSPKSTKQKEYNSKLHRSYIKKEDITDLDTLTLNVDDLNKGTKLNLESDDDEFESDDSNSDELDNDVSESSSVDLEF